MSGGIFTAITTVDTISNIPAGKPGVILCIWGNFTDYIDRSVQYAHERNADQTRSHKSVVTSWNRIEPNFQIINTEVHVMRKHVELQTRRKWNAATSFWIGLMVLMCLLIIQYRNLQPGICAQGKRLKRNRRLNSALSFRIIWMLPKCFVIRRPVKKVQ